MRHKKRPPGVGALEGHQKNHLGKGAVGVRNIGQSPPEGKGKFASSGDLGEEGADAGRMRPRNEGAPAGSVPVALPSLSSNNSTETGSDENTETDSAKLEARAKALKNQDRKRGFALGENAKYLIEKHGLEFIGFLTLTFEENLRDAKEAQRRFNSLATHVLRVLFVDYVRVIELQRRGAIHYHLLVVCREDVRTGFDFDGIKRGDYRSAGAYLRAIWRELREAMPRYGFGRSELLPIRSTAEAAARYVGKYLSKGASRMIRAGDDDGVSFKGVRMIQYSRGWRPISLRFSWADLNGGHSHAWRQLCDEVARRFGVDEEKGLQSVLGRRWSWLVMSVRIMYPKASDRELADILAGFRTWER